MTFGTGPFGAGVVLDEGTELETHPAEDRIKAPAAGGAAPLSAGPLVEANTAVFNAATGVQYVLGLDFFEVLGTSPGEVENIRIPAGTGLRAEYFFYESSGLDGTTPAAPLPGEATDGATTTRRFSTMLKFGA